MDSRNIWEAKSTGFGDRLDSGKVTEGEGTSGLLPYDSMHAGTFTELGDRTGKLAFSGGGARQLSFEHVESEGPQRHPRMSVRSSVHTSVPRFGAQDTSGPGIGNCLTSLELVTTAA